MQEIKISNLDTASTLDGTEVSVVVQSGVTKKTTLQTIANIPSATGVSGTFTTVDSKTVTVTNGVITSIV
jgi:hypothetical protein